VGPGVYGTGFPIPIGPGYNYYSLSAAAGLYDGALLYPIDNYFNLIGTGPDPLQGPVGITAGNLIVSRSTMGYVAPYNGQVVSVNVNSAYSDGYFDQAGFDFLIIGSGGAISPGATSWITQYATGRYMSGFSQSFGNPTTFSAGDLILCYIGDYGGIFTLPIPPHDGEFNVTIYVKYFQ
jgi:hypothetical protein